MSTKPTKLSSGRALLHDSRFNRGTAFTDEERTVLGLDGLLPAAVLTLEEQAKRSYTRRDRFTAPLSRGAV